MSFLDSIRDRFRRDDDYYDDEYYEEDYYEEDAPRGRSTSTRSTGSPTRLLGTTPRPEAESVSVYTRSGRPVTSGRDPEADRPTTAPWRGGDGFEDGYEPSYPVPSPVGAPDAPITARVSSGQLPAYVLRPVSYDDVQSVVRRVRTNQPVVLIFKGTNIETAKRILDFCYGLSLGIGGEVEALGDRVFAVLPQGIKLSQGDIDKLVDDGDLVR